MARTCAEAEASRNYNELFQSIRNSVERRHRLSAGESLASSAVKTAIDVKARFMVVMSETGTTARYVAKFRPPCIVICLTPDPTVARQCSGLLKAVHSFVVKSLEDTNGLVNAVSNQAIKFGLAEEGDRICIVCGNTYGRGANDQIKVEAVKQYTKDVEGESDAPGHLKAGISFPHSPIKYG
jgi:pyruvate kinase